MTEPTDVRELRERLRIIAADMQQAWDRGQDLGLFASDATALLRAAAALERLEKLEVRLPKSGDGAALLPGAKLWREHLGSVWHAEVVAVSVNWIDLQYTNDASHGAKWAISRRASPSEWLATPAPAPQQGGTDD